MKEINPRPLKERPALGYNPTGKRRPDEDTFRLQNTVLALRKEGLSFPQIGERINRTQGYAYKVYTKALRAIVIDNVTDMRKLEIERLDTLQQEVTRVLQGFTPMINQGRVVRDFMEDEFGNVILDEDGNRIPIKLEDFDIKMKAVTAALRIMERRAKLLGLDAPVKQEISLPNVPLAGTLAVMTLEQAQEEAAKRGLPSSIFEK